MNIRFPLLFIIYLTSGIICFCECRAGYKEAIVSCDTYIDSLIQGVLHEQGDYLDPHPINESILSFRKKIVFVDFNGEARLSEGFITGLSNIYRVSSCYLSFENERLKLSARLRTDHLFFNFTGSVKFMKMGPVIFVRGNSSTVDINMSFTMNGTTGKESLLEEFYMEDMKDIAVSIDGLRLLTWMNEPMKNSAALFFKASTKKLIEEMRLFIEKRMIAHPFSLEEFEIDMNEITDRKTTTTEDTIEGKLVYTKEDSNSYIDGILENRFLLEAHYSKLDPYTLEDDRLDNAFISTKEKQNYIELTNGSLNDLFKIKRIKDCSQPVLRATNITFICYLGFDKLEIRYLAKAFNSENAYDFEMITDILNTRMSAKITTNVKDNIPNIIDFSINNLGKFTIKAAQVIAEGPLFLANSPFNKKVIIEHFSALFKRILVGRLRDVLSYSVYKTPIHFLDYID